MFLSVLLLESRAIARGHILFSYFFQRRIYLFFFFQYEIIHNPLTVDLLVSLAFASASDGAMDEPLPLGLGLRVPPPIKSSSESSSFTLPIPYYINDTTLSASSIPTVPKKINISEDGLCEFDELDRNQVRIVYSYLLAPC